MDMKALAIGAALAALASGAEAQTDPHASHSHEGMSAAEMAEHMKTHSANEKGIAGSAVAQPDVVVKVNGLVCDFCARTLEKSFKGTGKVATVSVDLSAKEVRLKFRPGASLDDATIRKLVKNAGYAVVDLKRRAA